MPTLRLLPEFEDELKRLPGIIAASVVTGPDAIPNEIHVLAEPGKPPKQVVRDVQSFAMLKLGLDIDHRIVSVVQIGADETAGSAGVFNKLVDKATGVVMAGFGREEELEADRKGIVIANTVGYNPTGLKDFLTTLADRNKASTEKQGLFASHPEMKERFEKLDDTVKANKLAATATVDERYKKHVTYEPVAITAIATVEKGSAGLAGGGGSSKSDDAAKTDAKSDGKTEEPKKKRGFGLGRLIAPSKGGEQQSSETTGSSAARGVDTERNAKGGGNPALVAVTVTAADLTAFKKDGKLN